MPRLDGRAVRDSKKERISKVTSRIIKTLRRKLLRAEDRALCRSIEERLAAMGDEPSKSLNLEELKAKYLGGESESIPSKNKV